MFLDFLTLGFDFAFCRFIRCFDASGVNFAVDQAVVWSFLRLAVSSR